MQPRPTAGTSRLAQGAFATSPEFLVPTPDRLPMHSHSASHLRLVNALTQQLGCLQATLFQLIEISPHSCWISHAKTIA
jgi:hypothetical protein